MSLLQLTRLRQPVQPIQAIRMRKDSMLQMLHRELGLLRVVQLAVQFLEPASNLRLIRM